MIETIAKTGRPLHEGRIQIISPADSSISGLGSIDAIIVDVYATEVILKYQVITSDGRVADSNDLINLNNTIGIAVQDANPGFMCRTQIYGVLENLSWSWSGSGGLYLNGQNITQSYPISGFLKILGHVRTSTTMFVNLEESILY